MLVGAAMARAAERAYGSVREPGRGHDPHRRARDGAPASRPSSRTWTSRGCCTDVDDDAQNALIADVLERALRAGEQSVERGPELLPVLREAGVVDAGGYGLTVIFAGVIAALRGTEAPELDHHAPARVTHPQHESSTFRYCTNFAVTGEDLDAGALDRRRSRSSATRCWSSATATR